MTVGRLLKGYYGHPGEMKWLGCGEDGEKWVDSRNVRKRDTIGLGWVIEYQRKRGQGRPLPQDSGLNRVVDGGAVS